MSLISKDDIGIVENSSLETVSMDHGKLLLAVLTADFISINREDAENSKHLVCITIKQNGDEQLYLYYANDDDVITTDDGCFYIHNIARSAILNRIDGVDPRRWIWVVEDNKVMDMGHINDPLIHITPIYPGSDIYVAGGLYLYKVMDSSAA